jgi:eukaryotic-like serine/threonine-protein kinase
MPPGNCPSASELRSYALGKMSEEASAALGAHLRRCPQCVAELDGLNDATDPLIARLRSPHANDVADSPELRQAVARLLAPPPKPADGHAASLPPGTMLREYRIIEKLGAGGMGVVYRAVHTRIDKEVAIKVISSAYVAHPEAISRFGREMKAAGRFQHPNVVQATDGGEVNGLHFFVMEFVPGVNLSNRVRKQGTLRVSEACDVIAQAARGLHHAHAVGLVHRDIKPSNLLITPQGTVKVLDLGLALLRDEAPDAPRSASADAATIGTGDGLTTTSHMLGTNEYIAPEQTRDPHSVDARADIFSLGCTLIYLLTGKPPERTIDGGFNLRAKRPDVSRELEAIALKMLAERPEDRFVNAGQVADAIARLVEPIVKPKRRSSLVLVGGGAITAAALAMALWAATRTHPPLPSSGELVKIADAANNPPEELPLPRVFEASPPLGELPMDDSKAKGLQKQWATYTKADVESTNSLGMKFALIPPGEYFIQPSSNARVRITRPYYMGVHEVTRKQFAAYIEDTKKKTVAERNGVSTLDTVFKSGKNASSGRSIRMDGLSWRNPGYDGAGDDHPVSHVNWDEAVDFCAWLSTRQKRKYRLPTDAEWEWAARAGCPEMHPADWQTDPKGNLPYVWYLRNADDHPHPVGLLWANAWGLKDCLGNVREWCSDWYGKDTPGLTEDPKGPKKEASNLRVLRGGDYREFIPNLSLRMGNLHYFGSSGIGFRVVREIEP